MAPNAHNIPLYLLSRKMKKRVSTQKHTHTQNVAYFTGADVLILILRIWPPDHNRALFDGATDFKITPV